MFFPISDVADFHKLTGLPILNKPTIPAADRVELRWNLVNEEVNNELKPAIDADDLVGIGDAIVDSIYVLIGMALEYGLPLPMLWQAVQNANMSKADPVTGEIKRREDGKILKPEGWKPPDVAGIIEHATKYGSWMAAGTRS